MVSQPTLGQVLKAVRAFCEENSLKFSARTGRPPILSLPQLFGLLVFWHSTQIRNFLAFYHDPLRGTLEEFFPRLPLLFEVLAKFFHTRQNHGTFIVDSTPMKLCLEVRMRRFKSMTEACGKAVCATKVVYGFKVHILCDWSGKTAVNFCFSKGSASDVSFLEKLTENCTGSGIGDSGYVAKARAERLKKRGFIFTAKARRNMKAQNTPDEKRQLRGRYRIENFIRRLKEKVGEDFARFHVWARVKVVVAAGIVALNLGL